MIKRLITEKQHENQNKRWMRVHNLKLCKCGVRISVNQKTCSFCLRWAKLDRGHQRYIRTHGLISLYNKCSITAKQKRLITKRQEEILQLCHHDFEGLTHEKAAERLNISRITITKALLRVKIVLPQYFPIFTKFEIKCYHYYMVDGWSVVDIAKYVERAPYTIYRALQRVRNKGAYFAGPTGRVLSYDASTDDENEGMDAQVVQKF